MGESFVAWATWFFRQSNRDLMDLNDFSGFYWVFLVELGAEVSFILIPELGSISRLE